MTLRLRINGAWERDECGRLLGGTWAVVRRSFAAAPCQLARMGACLMAPELRLKIQKMLNDVQVGRLLMLMRWTDTHSCTRARGGR